MTDEELIERLRTLATNMFQSGNWGNDLDTTKDAADRIEEHSRAFANLQREYDKRGNQIEALEKRLDAVKDKAEAHIIDLMAERDRYELLHKGMQTTALDLQERVEALQEELDFAMMTGHDLAKMDYRDLVSKLEARAEQLAATNKRLEAALKRVLRNVDEDGVGTVLMIDLIHARAALKGAAR